MLVGLSLHMQRQRGEREGNLRETLHPTAFRERLFKIHGDCNAHVQMISALQSPWILNSRSLKGLGWSVSLRFHSRSPLWRFMRNESHTSIRNSHTHTHTYSQEHSLQHSLKSSLEHSRMHSHRLFTVVFTKHSPKHLLEHSQECSAQP